MRRKLLVGLFLAAVAGIVTGDYLINRTGAQDAPKKAEPEKKIDGNLYDILKRDLEAKKDVPPSIPVPPPIVAPKEEPKNQTPKVSDVTPPDLPSLPNLGQTPPPVIVPPPLTPKAQSTEQPKAKPESIEFPPLSDKPVPVVPQAKPAVDDLKPFPPLATPQEKKLDDIKPPPVEFQPPPSKPSMPPQKYPPTVPLAPAPPIAEEVAKIKNCPWSLQVEVIDGQTVVIATVNKKHEFKIVCQSLDLQTGKGTLKASGKVQITGDLMTASCDQLAIPLLEDRLLLEGGSQVSIQKISTVSTERAARFELKGDRLDLRVSDLNPDRAVQASPSVLPPLSPIQLVGNPPIKANEEGKKWTPYGTLRRFEAKIYPGKENAMWTLEDRDGNVIARVLARQGGSLRSFEGQTISVLGVSERIDGETYLRVTHVALP